MGDSGKHFDAHPSLISDAEEKLCTQFDVIHLKNRYGKQVRSTFVIGTDGTIKHEWRGVKVAGHAHAVLDFVSALAQYSAKA